MQYITDLEIHSKYARACSPNSDLEHHAEYADKKGINLLGTGDFTHPEWFAECKRKLAEDGSGSGVYKLKEGNFKVRFILSAEISCIYRKRDATRRIHNLIFAPNFSAAEKLNKELTKRGAKLAADGRPILGMDLKDVLELCLEIDKEFLFIPAHVWTPWFGFYGSKSGFDSLEDAFEELTPFVAGIETGLSSDPPMNWRIKELDDKAIVSFSDAHSPANLAREATVVDLAECSYSALFDAIKNGYRTNFKNLNKIVETLEFFPEEGKYHYDGHRACNISLNPVETKKHNGLCPSCKKRLTVGVLYRVQEIADREEGFIDPTRPGYRSVVPLREIIAEAIGVGKQSKRVEKEYESLVTQGIDEFNILLNMSRNELAEITDQIIAEGILRVREGKLRVVPGYDGVFGVIEMFTDTDRKKSQQEHLF